MMFDAENSSGRRRLPAVPALLLFAWIGAFHAHGQKLKFVVYGDTRDDPPGIQIARELGQAITNEQPDFVLFTGDVLYSACLAGFQWYQNEMLAPFNEAGIPFYPVEGNHKENDVSSFTNIFGPALPDNGPAGGEKLTYSLTFSNVLILAIDTLVTNNYCRVNQSWIDAVLAANHQRHVFAFGHAPAFRVYHTDCLDNYPTNRDAFWNSLSNAGCRIYFSGHDHFYDHMGLDDHDGNSNNDLHQIILGTGGSPPIRTAHTM